jgi:hypothetical protein
LPLDSLTEGRFRDFWEQTNKNELNKRSRFNAASHHTAGNYF